MGLEGQCMAGLLVTASVEPVYQRALIRPALDDVCQDSTEGVLYETIFTCQ